MKYKTNNVNLKYDEKMFKSIPKSINIYIWSNNLSETRPDHVLYERLYKPFLKYQSILAHQ